MSLKYFSSFQDTFLQSSKLDNPFIFNEQIPFLSHCIRMKYLLFIFLLMSQFWVGAQNKVEREFRIDLNQVPDPAIQWLSSTFPKTRKLKWFYEETSGKQSYEAKFVTSDNDIV